MTTISAMSNAGVVEKQPKNEEKKMTKKDVAETSIGVILSTGTGYAQAAYARAAYTLAKISILGLGQTEKGLGKHFDPNLMLAEPVDPSHLFPINDPTFPYNDEDTNYGGQKNIRKILSRIF